MKYIILLLTFYFFFPRTIFAISNPLEQPNNKYGIHIVNENDLANAAKLVNSQGGDWGYVTIVIPEDERRISKWNNIFDTMNELHLIPIVRLATKSQGNVWMKPKLEDALPWADFLSKLNWVTKNRYVIIFNEPNHAKEWGGDLNPEEYTEIINSFSATLKNSSDDFFILSAGFDASAPNSNTTMDEAVYLKAMIASKPDIFSSIDGWVSHSYPNPGFAGSIEARGRGTIATYEWERQMLKNLGVEKKLPIFITETGWPHNEGINFNKNYFPAEKIAEFIPKAAETVWNNTDIVAMTPFILNYQSIPFANFSWQKIGEEGFYPQYDAYRNLPKKAGGPLLSTSRITPTPNPTNQILGEGTSSMINHKNSKNILLALLLKPLSFIPFISKFISLNI